MRGSDRPRPDNHIGNAGVQVGLDSILVADTAADLNRDIRVFLDNAVHDVRIDGLAGDSAVKINDVEPARALLHPAIGDVRGIVTVYFCVVHAPLAQANAFSIFYINRRDQQHGCFLRMVRSRERNS